jgi:hypothetical protein
VILEILVVTRWLMPRIATVREFAYVTAVALWLGGFTFYGAVVIHVGMKVLGGHVRQGFITQRVTGQLNWIGVAALAILVWHATAIWPGCGRVARSGLALSLLIMIVIQAALFIMHPMLDRLLDFDAHTVVDEARFRALHRHYLTASTVQWGAGLLFIWCAATRRREGRGTIASS